MTRARARAKTPAGGRAVAATLSREAVAASFIERQWLDRPRARRLGPRSLAEFVERTGGLQIDTINVLERAHYLTLWSRFGAYDRRRLDRMIYRQRTLFEYWSHAACFVPRSHAPHWRRVMADYRTQHVGWGSWLRKNARLLREVEAAVGERGPLGNSDFAQPRPRGGTGWWGWKPAAHALHFLWMSGRLLVSDRVHFQKRLDLAERVLPELATVEPETWPEFLRWHTRLSLAAMGAATETDLRMYLSFPRVPVAKRRQGLTSMLASGEAVAVAVDGDSARWYALAADVPAIQAAGRRRRGPRGTTLLSPFDSLLWHRDRVRRLFGFDYRVEIYTPGPKRVHGYYSLPIFHDGLLIGRLDAKNHRADAHLEIRNVHFESWFVKGETPPGAHWGRPDRDTAIAGVAESIRSLGEFLQARRITCLKVQPTTLTRPMKAALEAHSDR